MKAYKLRDDDGLAVGFLCDQCDCLFTGPSNDTSDIYVSGAVWYCSDGIGDNNGRDGYYRSVDQEYVWWCPDGCFHPGEGSEPKLEQIWVCGNCGSQYANEDDAVECCD